MTESVRRGGREHRGNRYLAGLSGIALLTVGVVPLLPGTWRPGLLLALGLALAVQAPLGTWLVATLGSDRFLPVWMFGMLARLVVVGVAGLALYPALRWPLAPGLISLVVLLMASVALEAVVLLLEVSRVQAR